MSGARSIHTYKAHGAGADQLVHYPQQVKWKPRQRGVHEVLQKHDLHTVGVESGLCHVRCTTIM